MAGGLSRRMGGVDKCFVHLNGITLIDHVILRFKPQTSSLVINANGDHNRFGANSLPIVRDIIEDFAGPLAGIHALLNYGISMNEGITHVASIAADTPFFPHDFVEKCVKSLHPQEELDDDSQKSSQKSSDHKIILAKCGQYRHPTFGLWPVSLCNSLGEFLEKADTRKVMAFVQMHPYELAEFDYFQQGSEIVDPFFNINTPQDLQTAHTFNNPAIMRQLSVTTDPDHKIGAIDDQ